VVKIQYYRNTLPDSDNKDTFSCTSRRKNNGSTVNKSTNSK